MRQRHEINGAQTNCIKLRNIIILHIINHLNNRNCREIISLSYYKSLSACTHKTITCLLIELRNRSGLLASQLCCIAVYDTPTSNSTSNQERAAKTQIGVLMTQKVVLNNTTQNLVSDMKRVWCVPLPLQLAYHKEGGTNSHRPTKKRLGQLQSHLALFTRVLKTQNNQKSLCALYTALKVRHTSTQNSVTF